MVGPEKQNVEGFDKPQRLTLEPRSTFKQCSKISAGFGARTAHIKHACHERMNFIRASVSQDRFKTCPAVSRPQSESHIIRIFNHSENGFFNAHTTLTTQC